MESQIQEIANQAGAWSPEIIVTLIRDIAWPTVILILGFRFKGKLAGAVVKFFAKNDVTEVTAGTSGVTAKFQAAKQSAEIKETVTRSAADLPEGADYEGLTKRQDENGSEFSQEIYENVKVHVEALSAGDAEKIDLLSKEVSLLQSAVRYLDISKVLFRSQFDLFNTRMNDGAGVTEKDIKSYFERLVESYPEGYEGWDHIKYMAYPVSNGVVRYKEGMYELTKLGNSYVEFMRKSPAHIDGLSNM